MLIAVRNTCVLSDTATDDIIELRQIKHEIQKLLKDSENISKICNEIYQDNKYVKFVSVNKGYLQFVLSKKMIDKLAKSESFAKSYMHEYLEKMCQQLNVSCTGKRIYSVFDIYIEKNKMIITL